MEILLHLLYEDPQGKLCTYEWRLPLSQFVDLSGDAEEGTLQISLQVTELDLEADSLEESHRLFLRMGIMAQCMVREIRSIRMIEDAFCTDALLEPRWKEWNCRPLLDSRTLQGTAQWRGEEALGTPLELWATAEEPQAERQEDCIKLKVPLCCTLLYYDGDGTLRGKELHPTMEAELPVNPSADCVIREIHCGEIYCNVASGRLELRIPVELTVDTYGNQKLRGLQGGKINPLPDTGERRPSVILRRMEQEEDLWTVAKEYRSPIKALREVNDLPDDHIPQGMMLLIPV
jgi:hypothetical protein